MKQSYQQERQKSEVDPSAPTIKVAIVFAEGKDKPSVNESEMGHWSNAGPTQMTPEWRFHKAARLLTRIDLSDKMTISLHDNSAEIHQVTRQRIARTASAQGSSDRQSSQSSKRRESSGADPIKRSLTPRNVQNRTLTIDSENVKLLRPGTEISGDEYDIVSTLIEVDSGSILNLLSNYQVFGSSTTKFRSSQTVLKILDQMISDMRRLCTRSPRLFRMSTRALIANSKDTRYGVSLATVFVTMVTSRGIRVLLERSAAYYLSLSENHLDQRSVRPKFLQALVMLLSFLNNEDLDKSKPLLENTFQIPGDRAGLELVIFKVLPLTSMNSQVFLKSLCNAYQPMQNAQRHFELADRPTIWNNLRLDLATKGYLLPTSLENSTLQDTQHDFDEDDLEAVFEHESVHTGFSNDNEGLTRSPSWFPPWPQQKAFNDSTVFQYLQHRGCQKNNGAPTQNVYQTLNDIFCLETTGEDESYDAQIVLSTGAEFLAKKSDRDLISQMQKATYRLRRLDSDEFTELVIEEDQINVSLFDAAQRLNKIIARVQDLTIIEERELGLSSSGEKASFLEYADIALPTEAKRVVASLVSPNLEQEELCAEAFKLGGLVECLAYVVWDMAAYDRKISRTIEEVENELSTFAVRKVLDERGANQSRLVHELFDHLEHIKADLDNAKHFRNELKASNGALPNDPIAKVIYPGPTSEVEFGQYLSQLSKKDDRALLLQCTVLVNSNIPSMDHHSILLHFEEAWLSLTVKPLLARSSMNKRAKLPDILKNSEFLWLGYYLLRVNRVSDKGKEYRANTWFRIAKHENRKDGKTGRMPDGKLQTVKLI